MHMCFFRRVLDCENVLLILLSMQFNTRMEEDLEAIK